MRLVLSAFLVAASATAVAADSEPTCRVRVVRAPADVRAAIEARIGIETECTKLDVRVIRTRDGYYVVASPPNGELFEGTVREPGLVGELVTSWARLPSEQEYEDEDEDEDEDDDDKDEDDVVAAPPTAIAAQQPSAPTPPVIEAREEGSAPRHRSGTRDLALGVQATDRGYAVRGELDIVAGRGFSLGIAIVAGSSQWAYSGEVVVPSGAMPTATLDFRDLRGLIVAAKTFGTGAWRVRVQAGIGAVKTKYAGTMSSFPELRHSVEGEGTTRMAEAAISVSGDLGPRWALSFGPLLSYYGQRYELDDGISHLAPSRDLDVAAFAALRRRL